MTKKATNRIRMTLVLGTSLLGLAAILLLTPPLFSHAQSRVGQVVNSGSAAVKQGTVRMQGPVRGPLYKAPPAEQPEREIEKEHPPTNTPVDSAVRPEDIRPTSPQTVVNVISETPNRKSFVPQAPGTFTLFRNDTPGDRPARPGAKPPVDYSPYEPSVGVNGRAVFYTTNNYAAVSGDRGQTFSYINPWDNFQADGTLDAVNGGFGGDQQVYYVRNRGLMCWLIQYQHDSTTNRQRLAVARSQADVLNNTWVFYDFTPATYGLTAPMGTTGVWLDFPDISVSDNFLYITTNVITLTPQQNIGAVIARLPLDQLASEPTLNFNFYYNDTDIFFRLTQGARGTMYWGSHNSNTQIRIYRWTESPNSIAWDDVSHTAYNAPGRGGYTATCSGDINFASYEDDKILGAWVANGVIGFMWDAAQGGGFARPHVQVLRFNESDRSLLTQGQIFNDNIAFMFPSVHPNDRGHLGGTIAYGCGGGSGNPGIAAWIADDFNNGTITPLESAGVAVGNRAEGRWGDYFATRVHSPYGNTWVGTGFALNTPSARDHRFVWFGRERDTPPPTNTIYVDLANRSRYEDGSAAHPYNTFTKGNYACSSGDTLVIRGGNYNETGQFNRAATVINQNGAAVIGKP